MELSDIIIAQTAARNTLAYDADAFEAAILRRHRQRLALLKALARGRTALRQFARFAQMLPKMAARRAVG